MSQIISMAGITEWHGRNANKLVKRVKNELKRKSPQLSKAQPRKEVRHKERRLRDSFTP